MEYDDVGDGQPDFTKQTASEEIWTYLTIPHYIWIQRNAHFPECFEDVYSKYSLIATTNSTRKDLYYYLGNWKVYTTKTSIGRILDRSLQMNFFKDISEFTGKFFDIRK